MKWYRLRIPLIALVLFLGLSAFYYKGFAQFSSSQTIELSPPSQEVIANPGETVKVKIAVRNPSKQTLPISTRVEDFTAEGEEGQVQLVDKSPYSVTGWSTVTPKNFTLGAGESQDIVATVSVPKDAAGGRYGSVVFSVGKTGEKEKGSGANLAQELASLFLLRISGPVTEDLQLSSFSAPYFSDKGPIPFSIKLKNDGNIHVRTVGLVNVTDMFNKKVEDVVIKSTNVFPKANRILQASLDKKFLMGKYTATAIVYYGSKNQSLTSTTTFYVFAVKLAIIVLGALILLYLMRKRLKKAFRALFKG